MSPRARRWARAAASGSSRNSASMPKRPGSRKFPAPGAGIHKPSLLHGPVLGTLVVDALRFRQGALQRVRRQDLDIEIDAGIVLELAADPLLEIGAERRGVGYLEVRVVFHAHGGVVERSLLGQHDLEFNAGARHFEQRTL